MTGNREDYIKVIYELGGERNRIATKDIAKALEISPPSVSEMLKKLDKEDVLDYVVYRGVKLTQKGIDEAVRIKKVHILWEVFLVEKLGYDLADVHEEADLLEHITSKKLEKKLEEYLDYPDICPHGTPLNHDQYLFDYLPLNNALLGEVVSIKRLKDNKEFLKSIKDLNLIINNKYKVINIKDGKYTLSNKEEIIKLSKKLAENIYIKKENLWKNKLKLLVYC